MSTISKDHSKEVIDALSKAFSIDEILSSHFVTSSGGKSSADKAALQLSAWCKASTSGDWNLFAERLKKDNIQMADCLARFSNASVLNEHSSSAQWFEDAKWIYAALSNSPPSNMDNLLDCSRPSAFQELFLNIISRANNERFGAVNENSLSCFDISALKDLNHSLLNQISDLVSPALYEKFVHYLKTFSLDGKLLPSDADVDATHYVNFISEMQAGGLIQLLKEKPVMLRLLATVVRQWTDSTAKLINRLAVDLSKIENNLCEGLALNKVHSIQGGLSDAHNSGYSVQILTFDNGTKVVYKPRDVRLDAEMFNFVGHLNTLNPPVQLRAAKTIASDGYGWVEFIEHTSCNSKEDLKLFYERSGAWLFIFYLFAGSDMHYENMIASGPDPVPIDLEMILQPLNPHLEFKEDPTSGDYLAKRKIADSVLSISMLPAYVRMQDNKLYDHSAVNAHNRTTFSFGWKNVNTNGMRWVQTERLTETFPNIPHINSEYAEFGKFLPEFIHSFESYATFLLNKKDSLDMNSLLDKFSGLPVRILARTTRFYYMLVERLKEHENMSDGISWSAQADFVTRLSEWDSKKDWVWPLQAGERFALLQLNIPYFNCLSNSIEISDIYGNSVIGSPQSGLDRSKNRWLNLSPKEIAWQVEMIKLSTLFLPHEKKLSGLSEDKKLKRTLDFRINQTLTKDDLREELHNIYEQINSLAYKGENSASWISMVWPANSDIGQLEPLGPTLYDGAGGIALFLAAYYQEFKDENAKALCLNAIAEIRKKINGPTATIQARFHGLGAASGLGSIVYLLSTIGSLLDNQSITDDAMLASQLFTDELISIDRKLDVMVGSAGGILSLLALYRKTNSQEVLNRAIRCGDHLLSMPRVGKSGYQSWVSFGLGKDPIIGMSHGAAGFAYALSALAEASGKKEFAAAAMECLAFEDANYNSEEQYWPDLRKDLNDEPVLCSWCHGATGIGLARLGSLRFGLNREDLHEDIQRAISYATKNWPIRRDSLCCGSLGLIEFLSEAGILFENAKIKSLAENRLFDVIAARKRNGDYDWQVDGSQWNLGFFKGISGVGYTILRHFNPSLPNVLIWE